MSESKTDHSKLLWDHWFRVPRIVATRAKARQLRNEAQRQGATVLDFAATAFISGSAADELLDGPWNATTGESENVRRVVVRVHERRGRLPVHLEPDRVE